MPNSKHNYRAHLITSILALEDLNDTLISRIINLGMTGEMKEVKRTF